LNDKTNLSETHERWRLLDLPTEILDTDEYDYPRMSLVIDAALTHLIQSRQNIDNARGELDLTTTQHYDTDVLGLRYRTSLDSRWRQSKKRLIEFYMVHC